MSSIPTSIPPVFPRIAVLCVLLTKSLIPERDLLGDLDEAELLQECLVDERFIPECSSGNLHRDQHHVGVRFRGMVGTKAAT